MEFNLAQALANLEQGDVFQVANTARPGDVYLFASFLPERPRQDYQATSGTMTVRSTMAGLVGMDSPYPPGGAVEVTGFSEQTAKTALHVAMPEKNLRDLHELLRVTRSGGGETNQVAMQEAFNFFNKVIVQGQLDLSEWLRAQALITGGIDWTFNKKRLLVDYGVPAGNFLPARTGNDGYGGSASKFWSDVRAIKRLLKSVRAWVMHSNTYEMIIANPVNNISITSETDNAGGINTHRLGRIVGNTERVSTDARDMVTIITYDLEAEVLDPANPENTIQLQFMPEGAMLAVGNNLNRGFVVGAGSTPSPENNLGYHHLAPTIEGNNRPGRWGRLYVPEERQWSLVAEGAANELPVIEAPEKLAVATTDMV